MNENVVVVGGGYAGVMAANRLTRRADVTVTLVNPRPSFVARPRLHQVAAGTRDAVVEYREVLAGRVRPLVGEVARIDAAGRAVELADGGALRYDRLVYAVGSGAAEPRVPGAARFAHPLATLEDARRLRSVLDAAPAAPVTVVGGGPTGVEAATELAGRGRRVTLVLGGELVPFLHPSARRSVLRRFAALGITVLDGRVAEVAAGAVRLADGRELPGGVTVWTAGFGVPDLAARSGLSTDAAGRLLTDETLTSVDDDRIVAAGDAAAPSGVPFRMSAYAAGCLGAHAADTVLARLAGERPAPVDLSLAAMCLSLGPGAGVFQLARKDEVALRVHIGGRAGAKVKEMTHRAGLGHLVKEAAAPGSHRWIGGDRARRPLLAEQVTA
ncbi:NAD(P)/FAD-dependent oxidoreductase [Actinomadura atramentaria]|uniref:NAD(P)/FAD-dependent oxidoreductase n=1 Tax=Actinomadura atramentaria TaxID=1990 RepID=UPI0003617360|nr:FAD-dependent oxidoreductase [Actinomadura atramentaria]